MTRNPWLTAIALCAACSASPKINVGNEPDGSVAGSGGAGVGGSAGLGGFGGGDNTLVALITEPPSEMAIEVVTISCAGDCKQVLVVASGGNDPYTFAWNDGVTTAAREICADDDTTFSVTVSDTAFIDGEFPYAAQTVMVSLIANVLSCPSDGGAGDAGVNDAQVPGDCSFVHNPSLEGTPTVGLGDLGAALPDWKVCNATPDVNPLFATLVPSDGATYMGVVAGTGAPLVESAGGTLCTTMRADTTTSFTVDVAVSTYIGGAGKLELWGGSASCGKDELLWTSPEISQVDTWQTFCVTVQPTADRTHIVAWPVPVSTGGSYVLVDNFRAVSNCPQGAQ